MIRVTLELLSAIDPRRSRVLGIAEISNVRGDRARADYSIRLSKWAPKLEETWKRGEVRGFDRLRLGPWDLLLRGLASLVGERNDLRDLEVDSTWDDDVSGATLEEKLTQEIKTRLEEIRRESLESGNAITDNAGAWTPEQIRNHAQATNCRVHDMIGDLLERLSGNEGRTR